jgi:hypothetical protein
MTKTTDPVLARRHVVFPFIVDALCNIISFLHENFKEFAKKMIREVYMLHAPKLQLVAHTMIREVVVYVQAST